MGPENQQMGGGWTSGDTGDIILTPSVPEEKSKKWIIVLAAAILAAVICVVVTVLITRGYKAKNPSVADAVSDYLEYWVYGTENENKVENIDVLENGVAIEYDADDVAEADETEYSSVYAVRLLYDGETEGDYWTKLYEKLDTLQDVLQKSGSAEEYEAINDYKNSLNNWREDAKYLYSNIILEAYNDNDGEELVKELVEKIDEDEDNNDSQHYRELGSYVATKLEEYEVYSKLGCLADGLINEECIAENEGHKELDILESMQNIRNIIVENDRAINDYLRDVMTILYTKYVRSEE